ncbi:hypothetical protein RF11_03086 [Thelohanellus kitauei]|nr:hypothetical protein RF11_03086 [Thelohanellus kitauei]
MNESEPSTEYSTSDYSTFDSPNITNTALTTLSFINSNNSTLSSQTVSTKITNTTFTSPSYYQSNYSTESSTSVGTSISNTALVTSIFDYKSNRSTESASTNIIDINTTTQSYSMRKTGYSNPFQESNTTKSAKINSSDSNDTTALIQVLQTQTRGFSYIKNINPNTKSASTVKTNINSLYNRISSSTTMKPRLLSLQESKSTTPSVEIESIVTNGK